MFFNRINEMKGGRAQPSRAWRHRKNVRNRFMLLTHLEWLLQSFEEQFVSSPDLEGCLRVSPATAVARRFTFQCTDFDREQLFLDPLVANRRTGITFICWHIPCAAPAWARISSEKETGVKTSFPSDAGNCILAIVSATEADRECDMLVLTSTAIVFPHPTHSEATHEAVLDAYGQALHV